MKRTFIIGDEWFYLKIYSGVKTADMILTETIKPLTEQLLKNKIIDNWFFIRYADPNKHLRVRFHITEPSNTFEIIHPLNLYLKPLIDQNLIWKVQTDTYQREIERYGAETIELVEKLFFYESNMIVNVIDMIEGDEGEIIRWHFGLRAIDSLLDDFYYDIKQKQELLNILKESFGREFGVDKNFKIQIDKKFRYERSSINNILDKSKDESSEILSILEFLYNKSEMIKPIASEIILRNKNNMPLIEQNNLLGSYIHMLCNRLFKSKQRIHELVLYNFLYRYYTSEMAKTK